MVTWFLIILGIVGIFILYKLVSVKHRKVRFSMILVLFIITFLLTSFYIVSMMNNVDMTTLNGFLTGVKVYSIWVYSGVSNLGSATGYFSAVSTNSTENKTTQTNSEIVNKTVSGTKNLMKPKPLK
jgi:hypothetical protein